MTGPRTPLLDSRDAQGVLAELLARTPAYLPEFVPSSGQPARALLQILARYMQVVIQRLDQAPDKNLLAFLDMMAISLIPPQPARAPVVFTPRENGLDTRLEAGVRLGAQVPGAAQTILFETESAIAVAAAKLSQVVSLWPERDSFTDHSGDLAGGRSFTLFRDGVPVRHELYLSHETLLCFAAGAAIDVEFDLVSPGSVTLTLIWEAWDGQAWRPFQAQDGTAGLKRSGVVTLTAECGGSAQSTIDGVKAYWIRARAAGLLAPDPARQWAMSGRVRLRSRIDRPLAQNHRPDKALANGDELDLTSLFYPFGKAPDGESAFYFASEEVFSKPSALATVSFTRVLTPEQEADDKEADYEAKVRGVQGSIDDAKKLAQQVVTDLGEAGAAVQAASTGLSGDINQVKQIHDGIVVDLNNLSHGDVLDVLNDLAATPQLPFPPPDYKTKQQQLDSLSKDLTDVQKSIGTAATKADTTTADAKKVVDAIGNLSAPQIAGPPPQLDDAILVWEYWNGNTWTSLTTASAPANNFTGPDPDGNGTAQFSFTVPKDLEATEVDGDSRRWLRARIINGSFNRLRLVNWLDAQTHKIQFQPIIEPRPPGIKDFFLGYTYRSPWQFPEQCVAVNDFQTELHSADVRAPGKSFAPFRPVSDTLPAMYLGFDAPLPNDLVSLYLHLDESSAAAPALVWEAFDGTAWQPLAVDDETENFIHSGVVSFVAPEYDTRPSIRAGQAGGDSVLAASAGDAARFVPGNRVEIRQDKASEIKRVRAVQGAQILLETPLIATYSACNVTKALLERFGIPRAWVRARLKLEGPPAETRVCSAFPNAVWAVQVQTVAAEVLGSGTGQPSQTVFFSQAPVIEGEQIEVRELDGARANVELAILRDELQQKGFSPDDLIRTVIDNRTGTVTEVWVRWHSRPHLFFSSPDDRHYVIERARGRVLFGDGMHGRIPTPGANNIRAARYQSTLGLAGNVGPGKIARVLGGASLVQTVTNPEAAVGGAQGETLQRVRWRGPQVMRHQGRALSALDYEALALEASPSVAAVKTLPATASNMRPAPGYVTLLIVPKSAEPQPKPPLELRRRVADFLAARAPATVPPVRIAVIGAIYLEVGVRAVMSARPPADSGAVKARALTALANFLHPASGGSEGLGWGFGRDVFLSDVAVLLKTIEGVDAVVELELLAGGVAVGEHVRVQADRIVAAGPLQVEMQGVEELACRCH